MSDGLALWITLKLAVVTTFWLLLIGTPLAWWLAQRQSTLRTAFEAIVALPLVAAGIVCVSGGRLVRRQRSEDPEAVCAA